MANDPMRVERYYTTESYMKRVFAGRARQYGFRAETKEEYAAWKETLRARLREINGMTKMIPAEPEPERLSVEQMDGYRREKWVIQTEPEVQMPFYILIPDGLAQGEKRPVMIAPHGHGSAGKYAVAGRDDLPCVAETIRIHDYAYGVEFVKRGYITFCPDARGFGERREWTQQGEEAGNWMSHSCLLLSNMAIPLGLTVNGMWVWDLMRLTDYIGTRSDCDAERIGCSGLSGGGLQTLYFAALDDRVKCCAASGYFYGAYDSLVKMAHNCSCNYVPHMWETCDMGDLGALIAPRPFLVESGLRDPLNGERGIVNVTEQLDITRSAYKLLGAGDRVVHHTFDGPHKWDGGAYDFFEKYL